MIDKPLYGNPLAGGIGAQKISEDQLKNTIFNPSPYRRGSGLADGVTPRGGGFETSFGLLDSDPNRERQYFYNEGLNKLFNMPMGVRMAAPKGFESVNKDQYEDFASKGATLQGASMFTDSMGGGYNLDLPRLTSGPTMPTQEEGIPGASGSNIPLNNFPGNPNRKPADPANLGFGGPSLFPNKIGGIENTAIASLPQPTEGVSQDVFGNPNYLDGTPSVNPIVTGPEEIASAETNPFNRVGQQLTGPNQDDILGTLKNIEQGIASLGQGGMDQSSFGGFNNNFGIGSFFPPYGGMYG